MAKFSESQENITYQKATFERAFYYGMLRRAPDQGGYDFGK